MEGKKRPIRLSILGIRGIPAAHGGFETFAEYLSLYLVQKGWQVTVYCQTSPDDLKMEDNWHGIQRVPVPVKGSGALSTISFDWKSTISARKTTDIALVLGYNTAIFSLLYRLSGIPNVINMDGIEWKRAKWRWWQKAWLYLNERVAGLLGTYLIADHPAIREHLERGLFGRKDIGVIPYGADRIVTGDVEMISTLGVEKNKYALVIARPEPENQILEIVRAFSSKSRGITLLVLGRFDPELNPYHAEVMSAASSEVSFPGAIYDKKIVSSLRYGCLIYIHGHTVGGTNPSLVEALGAGSAILAHDNQFNRWVAGKEAAYFNLETDCGQRFDELLGDDNRLNRMKKASRVQFQKYFTWDIVLHEYERILSQALMN